MNAGRELSPMTPERRSSCFPSRRLPECRRCSRLNTGREAPSDIRASVVIDGSISFPRLGTCLMHELDVSPVEA